MVHNVAGSQPHVQRVTTWPQGDFDYSVGFDDETDLPQLAEAARWKLGHPRSRYDKEGCLVDAYDVQRARGTVFDDWAYIFGMEWQPATDR